MISRLARVTMFLATGVLMIAVLATAQQKDPFVGTWRLNIAKSKYSPGPPPKSQVEADGAEAGEAPPPEQATPAAPRRVKRKKKKKARR